MAAKDLAISTERLGGCGNDACLIYALSGEVYWGPEVFPPPRSYEGRVNPLGPS